MKKKSELPAERRVLKLKRETVRLLDLKVADLETVAGGALFITRPTGPFACGC